MPIVRRRGQATGTAVAGKRAAFLPGCLTLRAKRARQQRDKTVRQDVDDFAAATPLPVWSRQSKTEKAVGSHVTA